MQLLNICQDNTTLHNIHYKTIVVHWLFKGCVSHRVYCSLIENAPNSQLFILTPSLSGICNAAWNTVEFEIQHR